MNKEAIAHRSTEPFVYAYDEETLHVRLQAKRDDLQQVSLFYGDPFEYDDHGPVFHESKMEVSYQDDRFDYWTTEIKPVRNRTHYLFSLKDHGTVPQFLAEKGFLSEIPTDLPHAFFKFPYLNKGDVFKAPSWVKNTVWYQIFPERFANGDSSINPEITDDWGDEPDYDNYFGGDFQGVIDHLDYIENLGVNGIYFTPIFKANTNHKYDTMDYMEIDPQFGDKETFKKLIKACHDRGIKVMLDAVFNHSGFYFEPFQDVLTHGENSKYVDWFHIHSFPIEYQPIPNYETFAYEPKMPKLNTSNHEVKQYLLDVATYWIREFDIDGWRLDVANEVDHHFWRDFRNEVKNVKEDVYILGEIWHDSLPWLRGDQFDAVMNYPLTEAALDFFVRDLKNHTELQHAVNRSLAAYPKNANEVAFNLLGSHDTPRILTRCEGNVDQAKQLFLYLFTSIGSPCIYYGDEIGLTGGEDPGCRKCMVWDESQQDHEMLEFTKKLIDLRKTNECMQPEAGITFMPEYYSQGVLAYKRESGENEITIVMNTTDEITKLQLKDGPVKHALLQANCTLSGDYIILGKQGFIVY
ncbi:glycoside hydrolase family 13 protein [Halalkalibacillus halophilus]|uniref:glycoside hydrolase family 13 protein n=1 Tax=Halalkalibacillus halophilus TaxID=392827 RepID=UPI000412E84F|nr:glycoside hydrolase family 13 protein [Halalkalibacillus halophilus]